MSNKNKKFAMFSNGSAIVTDSAGDVRTASKEEIVEYLKSLVPSQMKGSKLAGVKYDNGYVKAKYASGKIIQKKILVAQNDSAKQSEPLNSGDKSNPDIKVPRNESKAKPESKNITKDRPDVGSPNKVRKDDYKRGKGGEDLHTDNVPRSKSNSGLEGGSKTDFAEETGSKATSGNPDTYVQEFKDYKKPTPAGNKMNHAAESNIELRPESEIYDKVKIAFERKQAEKSKLPPWLRDKKKDDATNDDEEDSKSPSSNEKEAKLLGEIKKAEKSNAELKKEINKYKLREVRQAGAIKLALAYRDMNPNKYASAQSFLEKVNDIAKKMSPEAMETAFEELNIFQKEASNNNGQMTKQASTVDNSADGGVATVFSSVVDEVDTKGEPQKIDRTATLKEVLLKHSSLNKNVEKFKSWKQENSLENNGGR